MFVGSPWRDKISLAILELQEKGEIQMLYDKWWKSPGDTCMRTEKGKENKANALGVDNIGENETSRRREVCVTVLCYRLRSVTKFPLPTSVGNRNCSY